VKKKSNLPFTCKMARIIMFTLLLFITSLSLVSSQWVNGNNISSDMHKTNEYKELFLNRDVLLNNANRVTSPRVVGGTDAGGHIDYQVLLLLDFGDGGGYGRCGGSLIAPNVVLSALSNEQGESVCCNNGPVRI